MTEYFQFEADFVESLRCIPMQVRLKLDSCGVKLKLHHWHQLSHQQRQTLTEMPCNTQAEVAAFRHYLQGLVVAQTGEAAKEFAIEPQPTWLNPHAIPAELSDKARAWGVELEPQQWAQLTPLQRFALIKLARPGHESKNFHPALVEFGLLSA